MMQLRLYHRGNNQGWYLLGRDICPQRLYDSNYYPLERLSEIRIRRPLGLFSEAQREVEMGYVGGSKYYAVAVAVHL